MWYLIHSTSGHRLMPAQHWVILCCNDAWCTAITILMPYRFTSLSHGCTALSHIDAWQRWATLMHDSIETHWCMTALSHIDAWYTALNHTDEHLWATDAQHWAMLMHAWCTALSYNWCIALSHIDAWCTALSHILLMPDAHQWGVDAQHWAMVHRIEP